MIPNSAWTALLLLATADSLGLTVTVETPQGAPRLVVDGRPVRGAMVEMWQANAAGRYHHPADRQAKAVDPAFRGWGRASADFETGIYRFDTVKPGPVAGRRGRMMAPRVNFWIVARGINIGLNTRMYFSDEADANAEDPILMRIEHRSRVPTLIGNRDGSAYTFDIYLQGPNETVFFDV